MKNIIKTDNYLLIVSDEDIKPLDWCVNIKTSSIFQFYTKRGLVNDDKKIIAHLPLNNSPILEGVDLLPPLEDEAIGQPLADYVNSKHTQEECIGFIDGYNKAKEKYKYTEEDLRKCWKACLDFNKPAGSDSGINLEDFIQSLQQPKYPIGFECEMVTRVFDVYPQTINHIPKTTTNLQGQTVLEGKYIYE